MAKLYFFEPFPDARKRWAEIILPKIKAGHRVNIYFSSNTIPTHYFCLFQFWYLSRIAMLGNVYLYIVLNDQVRNQSRDSSSKIAASNKSDLLWDVKKIMGCFGISPDRVFAYYSSEISGKMFNAKKTISFLLFKSSRSITQKDLEIPRENCELEYMENNAQYPLSYFLPKLVDLFTAEFFNELCPEDIKGKIDVFVTSGFGRPLISKLRHFLVKDGSLSPMGVVFGSIPKIPFFGHTTKIFKKHIAPDIRMSIEEIYEVILVYHVKTEHMKELLDTVLKLELGGISIPGENGIVKKTKNFAEFEKLDYKEQALMLATNLFEFLQRVNNAIKKENVRMPLCLDSKYGIQDFSKLFRSDLTMQVLKECHGQKITEIAKKLNKHQPNISKIVGQLKKLDLVYTDNLGGLHRKVNTIKIELDKI